MENNHILAMVVAYYLSKYDRKAYSRLEMGGSTFTHHTIGKVLGVNGNTVKNMRDQFDSINSNSRRGWWQYDLPPSRQKVIELFQDLDEEELFDIVFEILTNPTTFSTGDMESIIESIRKNNFQTGTKNRIFAARAPTGRLAEEYFINFHRTHSKPITGDLVDKRDYGCGFDFEIHSSKTVYQIEVKGIKDQKGGILLSSKEWETAKKMGDSYFLFIVKDLGTSPTVQVIRNPSKVLSPRRYIYATVQVNWTVSADALAEQGE